MRNAHHGSHDPVYGITTADQSHTDDVSRRQKQYILTMLVRVVSIVVVVVVPGISWQIKVLLCLVATVIPYIAVVRANGGPMPEKDPTNLLISPPQQPSLEWEQRGLPGAGTVINGEADEAAEAADTEGADEGSAADEPLVLRVTDEQRDDAGTAGRATRA
ncbi:MAG TPA: DUF3099 domain-containing protein [Actinocrinis sp.]|nr:DUF3099 domain-containing protein [Actinocrinis sp.]